MMDSMNIWYWCWCVLCDVLHSLELTELAGSFDQSMRADPSDFGLPEGYSILPILCRTGRGRMPANKSVNLA
jgi:hypothetical protein